MASKKKYLFFLLICLISFVCFQFASSRHTIRIGIISDAGYCGERELGWRIKIAAESLGWKAVLDESKGRKLRRIKNLDWIICLLPDNKYIYKCPNYLTIFHPFNYLDSEGKLQPFYEKYNGYLLTVKQTEAFKNGFKLNNKRLFTSPFYPTLQYVEYQENGFNDLVTMIPVWGNRLTDEKFKTVYRMLGQSGFTKFYGVPENRDAIPEGYIGEVPFDGTSMIKTLQKHGIVLIFHSNIHNQEHIPSSRIFEAAAASTVIISDENAFVKTHFGDAVFYVDTSLSAHDIYLQIKNHMDTIQKNPQLASAMAKQAHQIFVDNFLMSDQLLNILSMHTEIKKCRQRSIFGHLK